MLSSFGECGDKSHALHTRAACILQMKRRSKIFLGYTMSESVAAIVFDSTRSKVLLVKRRDIPVWVLPGGGIDDGETPEEAALRECAEETGFHVLIARKIAVYEPRNRLARRTHFYECKIEGGAATIGSESQEVCFFPLNELPPLLSPPYPYWIRDAQKNTGETLHKEVEGVSYWIFLKLLIQHPILVFRFVLTRMGIHINS